MKKRILGIMLALSMVLSLLPMTALAAEPFGDVQEGDWYADAVEYVYDKGMMDGVGGGSFDPAGNLTRAMLVTILYRLEGEPAGGNNNFSDVPEGQWFTDAVAWAAENKIVEGYGQGLFGPNDLISREQLATILYRYTQMKGESVEAEGDLSQFPDGGAVAPWAKDAMIWAVARGLISGTDGNALAPQGDATRAQTAVILYRMDTTGGETTPPEEEKPEEPKPSRPSGGGHRHNYVDVAAVEATCKAPGMTAGKKCACGEVLEGCETTVQLGHTEEVVSAKAPTCEDTGLTEGKKCSVCKEILVAQQTVAALGHTAVVDPAVAATCTAIGLTEGSHCSICDKVLVAQTEVNMLAHTEEVISGQAATCTEAGMTDGKRCSVCGEVLKDQTNIPALGHSFITTTYKENPSAEGHQVKCTNCNEYGPVTVHSYGTIDNCTATATCSDCSYTKQANEHVWGRAVKTDDNQHTYTCTVCQATENTKVEDHTFGSAVVTTAATCTAKGEQTETCTGCGFEKKTEIAKKEHTYTVPQKDETHHWNKCATCDAIDETNKAEHTYGTPVVDGFKQTETCTVETCKHAQVTNYQAKIDDTLYATIAEAIAAAKEADSTETITVAPGTYSDAITIDTPVTLDGSNKGAIFTGGVSVTAGGVTVKNCTFNTGDVTANFGDNSNVETNLITFTGNTFINADLTISPDSTHTSYKVENNTFTGGNLEGNFSTVDHSATFTATGNTMNGGKITVRSNNYGAGKNPTLANNTGAQYHLYNMGAYMEIDTNENVTYYNQVKFGEGTIGTVKKLAYGGVISGDALEKATGTEFDKTDGVLDNCTSGIYVLQYTDSETNSTAYKVAYVENTAHDGGVIADTVVLINTVDDLKALATTVNSGNKLASSKIYLTANLDLNNDEWTPIGTAALDSQGNAVAVKPFSGNFYGQGYTISNLKITSGDYAGLFGYVKNDPDNYLAGIQNLTIENVDISNVTNGGAFFGGGVYSSRNTWYGGVQQFHDLTLTGNVKIEGVNVGGIGGSGWLDVRIEASNITVDVNNGSYVHGSSIAAGVFASAPHSDNVSDVTSNIDVRGEGVVGGIAGNGGWNWDKITCTGDVSLTTEAEGPYAIGTIFGQIADNTWWVTGGFGAIYWDNLGYDGLINMTNLSSTGTLTVNETITSNGHNSNMIGSAQFTTNTFDYVGNKVVLATPAAN